jgi:hypothetical protein
MRCSRMWVKRRAGARKRRRSGKSSRSDASADLTRLSRNSGPWPTPKWGLDNLLGLGPSALRRRPGRQYSSPCRPGQRPVGRTPPTMDAPRSSAHRRAIAPRATAARPNPQVVLIRGHPSYERSISGCRCRAGGKLTHSCPCTPGSRSAHPSTQCSQGPHERPRLTIPSPDRSRRAAVAGEGKHE